MEKLRETLRHIDGQSYKAYKALTGRYRFPDFTLQIDHVQGDPFAAPSRVTLIVPMQRAAFPEGLWGKAVRRRACEDYIGRAVRRAIRRTFKGRRGSGHSGEVSIAAGAQSVLRRNAVLIAPDRLEARITVGLPAAGRRILAAEAETVLFEELPALVEAALRYQSAPAQSIAEHVDTVDDQTHLREWLRTQGLVAFVADGALLPRRSGIDDRPLERGALTFRSPESLRCRVALPHAGGLTGMGIPAGVTLIVGGGFHGKSTLLHALERGVYDHIPGDGRERVVTDSTAMKIRAEDGRAISLVDISPFIDHLPFGRDTHAFTTDNASGSTSQAANIIEALETGSRVLLIDEDTSATNFMIRDSRMQQLVAPEKEPITPFLHRVRELYDEHGISTVLVMGGSGDYFEVADTVIMMDEYEPKDVTQHARRLAGHAIRDGQADAAPPFRSDRGRRPRASTLNASRGRHEVRIDVRSVDRLAYGERDIDLEKLEQLVDRGQTESIGWMIRYYAEHFAEPGQSAVEGLRRVLEMVEQNGLDSVAPWQLGTFAMPRLQELAGTLNRLRGGEWSLVQNGSRGQS